MKYFVLFKWTENAYALVFIIQLALQLLIIFKLKLNISQCDKLLVSVQSPDERTAIISERKSDSRLNFIQIRFCTRLKTDLICTPHLTLSVWCRFFFGTCFSSLNLPFFIHITFLICKHMKVTINGVLITHLDMIWRHLFFTFNFHVDMQPNSSGYSRLVCSLL